MVRAPPCHGGSCEFESRQSRFKNFISKFNNNIRDIIIKSRVIRLVLLVKQILTKDQIKS